MRGNGVGLDRSVRAYNSPGVDFIETAVPGLLACSENSRNAAEAAAGRSTARPPSTLRGPDLHPPTLFGARQVRSNGSRHACGAISWWMDLGPQDSGA